MAKFMAVIALACLAGCAQQTTEPVALAPVPTPTRSYPEPPSMVQQSQPVAQVPRKASAHPSPSTEHVRVTYSVRYGLREQVGAAYSFPFNISYLTDRGVQKEFFVTAPWKRDVMLPEKHDLVLTVEPSPLVQDVSKFYTAEIQGNGFWIADKVSNPNRAIMVRGKAFDPS